MRTIDNTLKEIWDWAVEAIKTNNFALWQKARIRLEGLDEEDYAVLQTYIKRVGFNGAKKCQ